MRATLAVAAREIADRKLALLGALLLGLVPLAIPLLPSLGGTQARDVRFTAALFLSLTIFVAFPVAFGATVMVSEIVQKRIAFYFSRPLSSASIWAGKMLAALIICICGACLAAVPTLIVDGKRALAAFDPDGPATAIFLLSTLLLLVAAHILSSMVRLRSAWIVLDFFLAAALAAGIAIPVRSLFRAGFWSLYDLNHSGWLLWLLAAPFIGALLVASCVQIAEGRTDARRSHGALSATLWCLVTLLAIPLAGFAWWVNVATPRDLTAVSSLEAAPRGTWVSVSGRLRARGAAGGSFLVDTESGRFLERRSLWYEPVAFSADGTRAAWGKDQFGFFERKKTADIVLADLATGRAVETGLECSTGWCHVLLSPSGRRLAIVGERNVAAYDVSVPENPKELAAFHVDGDVTGIAFVDEDTLRLFPRIFNAARQKNLGPTHVVELSLASKKSLVTGILDRETLPFLNLSPDARIFVGTRSLSDDPSGKRALTLHDGRTGALLATLADDLRSPQLRFLAGGGFVVAGIGEASARVLFFEGDKTLARTIDLGPAARVALGREITPGHVVVARNSIDKTNEAMRRSWKTFSVDAATGVVAPLGDGLVPLSSYFWWSGTASMPPAEAGSPASTLFLNASGALVRLDPATGAQTVLLGRSK